MRKLIIATLLLGAGCPAPRHALSIEVRSGGRPVASAVVALVCPPGGSGQLTDESGRVVFKMSAEQPLDRCRLVAGKVGFETVEARPGRACAEQPEQERQDRQECPALGLELVELGDAAPVTTSTPGSPSRSASLRSSLASSPAAAPAQVAP